MRTWPAKEDVLNASALRVCPQKVDYWQRVGVPLVIGRREGDFIWDLDGHRLYDMHLNGGTYNLGHRNPEIIEAMVQATERFDIGNHHFPSIARAQLAETFDRLTPASLMSSVFLPSGGEANDVAIKSARSATGRRKIVTFAHGFHGATGLAACAGDPARAQYFHSDRPEEFLTVPFADAEAIEKHLAGGDVAAVMLETIPASWGFAVPPADYLPEVVRLAHDHGALFIADEVQVGLGRTGDLWSVDGFGIEPDIMVTGKGLSGGIYPIAATLLGSRAGAWLFDSGWGHVSTFGGSEIGCVVADKVLEITTRPETVANVEYLAEAFGKAFHSIAETDPFLAEIRQRGVIFGLQFDHPSGGAYMQRELFDSGVWAIASGYDESVLQFKPGLLLDKEAVGDVLDRFTDAMSRAREQDHEIPRRNSGAAKTRGRNGDA